LFNTISILGASGFIGTALYKFLEKKRIKVKGYSRKKKKSFIKVGDYKDINANKSILIYLCQSNSNKIVNVNNEINNLKKIIGKNWEHIIYISSYLVKKKNNKYTFLKKESEKLLKNRATILRVSNIIGTGMSNKNILSKIIFEIKKKKNIIKFNNIYDKRDFILIDDVVRAIYKSIIKRKIGIFEIGSGHSLRVDYIVNLILNNNFLSRKIYSVKKETIEDFKVNLKKAKKYLDWAPMYNPLKFIKKINAL
jgi:nucleoside-diphosphate-sugar epimerase